MVDVAQPIVQKKDRIRVLYVDDELNNLIAFKASFRFDFEVIISEDPLEAIELAKEKCVEVVIADQRMPQMTGIEFFHQLKEVLPQPKRILLTGYSNINTVIEAINRGEIYRYMTKPWKRDELYATIKQAYELLWLEQERHALLDGLVKVNDQLEFMVRQRLLS